MVSRNDENIKCKYCNTIARLCYPVCSGIDQDKPFGSEMRYGRGVCDTFSIQDLEKHFCEQNEQKSKGKLVNHSNRNSSGSRKPDFPNASNVTMRSSTERDHFFENSEAPYEELLKKKLKEKYIKLAGPFTEPLNPGKQMKLGEPYYVRYRVEEDFYKDF